MIAIPTWGIDLTKLRRLMLLIVLVTLLAGGIFSLLRRWWWWPTATACTAVRWGASLEALVTLK